MEDAIKLLVFDFINFISFLKKQPNVPKSWLSRIKRLELKCDNLGLTSKSAVEAPPLINPSLPHSLAENNTSPKKAISSETGSHHQSYCDEAYVACWDGKDDFEGEFIQEPSNPSVSTSATMDLQAKPTKNRWSLKPEECDRDLLMEQSIKIGKMYVKNFKSLISSTLGKKVEKTALLTNDFRFLLYKANKPKIDTVLDIRGALIQSNKLKNKRFTITCSTDKVETIEFEACDEEERDSWVYVLFQASKGIVIGNSSSSKFEEDTYQKVQETDNYNPIIEDDINFDEEDDDVDGLSPCGIYKSPPNGQPVTQGDYPLLDDNSDDEDFEDDNDFDQEEMELLPSPPTPVPPESLYEFDDDENSSTYSSSSNSSLSLCSPVDTSQFLDEPPPSLPAKHQAPLKAPTDIPPKSKCLLKPCTPEIPPELPPKRGSAQRKLSSKRNSKKRASEPSGNSLYSTPSNEPTEVSKGKRASVDAPFPPPPRRASIEEPKSPETPPIKPKKKLQLAKQFLKSSGSKSKSYDMGAPTETPPVSPSEPVVSMYQIKSELIQKVEQRKKRVQEKQGGDGFLDDIRSNASSQSESKELDFLGKKPSEVKTSNLGVKPQCLKPKPVLNSCHIVGKVQTKGPVTTPDSPRTQYIKQKNKNKEEDLQKNLEAFQINEGSSTENDSEEEDDW